ncbi:LacI family transcriptional regulator [Thermosporothrix hazakensis]|jgi:LacI family transcriptional regulator/LacI family repressor for deo operon, udp, cdd, tsx, nupC, and nupG|uniref:LacI family transcriptional regulator n=1 Tax=Thermosporothrix hazakensis TaxID=644383 RepID=A0A326U7L8_THEHA|nr:LacI family DNA-binding transcriptional regulator [Thermosporothrix hazakensis]PZW29279.1 LacI family transcriptional regulator [Thermosporothrix hazakensis]GCE45368.1 ribose operon repressor RbsR [Thermosporothrix hazakensis]
MPRQEVSISDIARAAGVSHSTVSRALRDSSLISPQVRAQIQQLAREMGYTPNAIARSLQTQRTKTIGVVVTSIADPFYGDIVKGVEAVTRAAGFSVFLGVSHNDPFQEMQVIESFHQRRVDGLIIASSRITGSFHSRSDRLHIPTVLVNNQTEAQEAPLHWVAIDDKRGAMLAVEHLVQLGHRSIGYLGLGNRPRSNRLRLEGYRQALVQAGITPRPEWIRVVAHDQESEPDDAGLGRQALPELLDSDITALFCYNDMVAIGVLLACRDLGIAVPQQLSLVGFDDVITASYVSPALTTVHQPKLQLGQLAAQTMLDILQNRPVENHLLFPSLIVRSSTASL